MNTLELKASALKKVSMDDLKKTADDFNVVFKFSDEHSIKYDSKTTKAILATDIIGCLKLVQPGDKFSDISEKTVSALGFVLYPEGTKEDTGSTDSGKNAGTESSGDKDKGKDKGEGSKGKGTAAGKKPAVKKDEDKKKSRLFYAGQLVGAVLKASKDKNIDKDSIADDANKLYIQAGGKDNIKEAKWAVNTAMAVLEGFYE